MTEADIRKQMFAIGKKIRINECLTPVQDMSKGEKGMIELLLKSYPEPLCSGDIADIMKVGTGRVGNALKSLERKKLICRIPDKEDKRRVLVTLTKDGLEKARKSHESSVLLVDCVIHEFGIDRFYALLQQLDELTDIVISVRNKGKECQKQ